MPAAPQPPDEASRLEALHGVGLWETGPEERFDRIPRLALRTLGVAGAGIHLVGETSLFAKSRHGLELSPARSASFCAYTILEPTPLIVPDAQSDARFLDHPQVTDEPHIRFYAGAPLRAPDGSRVGTFYVIDRIPRVPSDDDLRALADFALMAQGEINVVELSPDYKTDEAEQEQLRLSEDRFRDIADVPGAFLWETTPEGRTTYVSERVEEVLGFTPGEIVSRGLFEGILAPDAPMTMARFLYAVGKKQRFSNLEFRYETKDGRIIWLAARGAPRHDAENKVAFYRGFVEEISERRRQFEEVSAARFDAEKAVRVQAEFVRRVSQEIRDPVNALTGLAGEMLGRPLDPGHRRQAEKIRENADKLLAIVTDLNDFARIESGQLQFENHPFDLQALVEDAVNGVAEAATDKGLELHWRLDSNLPAGCDGDEARLRQILVNLLSNAVATTEKGDVSLSVARAETDVGEHFILFSVWNSGPGFSAEKLEHLFDLPEGAADDMGLSISRSLTELMGGRVWAENEAGRGVVFHVAVPLPDAEPPDRFTANPVLRGKTFLIAEPHNGVRAMLRAFAESWGMRPLLAATGAEAVRQIRAVSAVDVALVDEEIAFASVPGALGEMRKQRAAVRMPCIMLRQARRSGDPGKDLPADFVAALARPAPYRALHQLLVNLLGGESNAPLSRQTGRLGLDPKFSQRHPLRIFVAEEKAINRRELVGQFERMGYRPDAGQSGSEVLAGLDRQPYDVLLLDLAMPGMENFETVRQVRERFPAPDRPWIIAMARTDAEFDREGAQAAGIDAHLVKPIRVDALEAELARASDQIGQMVDFTVLSRYVKMTGSGPEAMRELVDIFAEETIAALPRLDFDLAGRRPQQIGALAAQLRRSSANFGAERMQRLCECLQAAAKAEDFDLAREFVSRLRAEFHRVKKTLEEFARSPAPTA